MRSREVFISVDVEASGPIPGEYSLLSIGACSALDTERAFYCWLKPVGARVDPEALAISGHDLEELNRSGMDPRLGMESFRSWVSEIAREGTPVFVGLNASFDWAFVNYYFHKYVGTNPFGHTALDIKSLYLGRFGGTWEETKARHMAQYLKPKQHPGGHHALRDAQFQAELFRLILANHVPGYPGD